MNDLIRLFDANSVSGDKDYIFITEKTVMGISGEGTNRDR